jgi:hypothetical protein
MSIVAFPIKNIVPLFGCVKDDDDVLMEEEEEEVVGSIISFVVLNMIVPT